jgi:hypothetical protein
MRSPDVPAPRYDKGMLGHRWQLLMFEAAIERPPGLVGLEAPLPDDLTIVALIGHSHKFPFVPAGQAFETIAVRLAPREDQAGDTLWPTHAAPGDLDCLCSRCGRWIDAGEFIVHVPEDGGEYRYCGGCC